MRPTGSYVYAQRAGLTDQLCSRFLRPSAHEVVLHKGDRIRIPEQHRLMRLVPDWSKWLGKAPEFRYIAELKPLAAKEGIDPGPGARRKTKNGLWVSTSDHPLDHHLRGGRKAPG